MCSKLKYGYKREDGYIFVGYTIKRGKKYEDFRSPKAFERQKEYHKINKKKVYDAITSLYNASKTKLGCFHCNKNLKKIQKYWIIIIQIQKIKNNLSLLFGEQVGNSLRK